MHSATNNPCAMISQSHNDFISIFGKNSSIEVELATDIDNSSGGAYLRRDKEYTAKTINDALNKFPGNVNIKVTQKTLLYLRSRIIKEITSIIDNIIYKRNTGRYSNLLQDENLNQKVTSNLKNTFNTVLDKPESVTALLVLLKGKKTSLLSTIITKAIVSVLLAIKAEYSELEICDISIVMILQDVYYLDNIGYEDTHLPEHINIAMEVAIDAGTKSSIIAAIDEHHMVTDNDGVPIFQSQQEYSSPRISPVVAFTNYFCDLLLGGSNEAVALTQMNMATVMGYFDKKLLHVLINLINDDLRGFIIKYSANVLGCCEKSDVNKLLGPLNGIYSKGYCKGGDNIQCTHYREQGGSFTKYKFNTPGGEVVVISGGYYGTCVKLSDLVLSLRKAYEGAK